MFGRLSGSPLTAICEEQYFLQDEWNYLKKNLYFQELLLKFQRKKESRGLRPFAGFGAAPQKKRPGKFAGPLVVEEKS